MDKNKIVEILRLAINAVAEDPVEYLKGEGYDEETANLIVTDNHNVEYVENLLDAELAEILRDVLNEMSMDSFVSTKEYLKGLNEMSMASFVSTKEYLKGEGYSKEEIRFILGT